jgi:hypothetical protein
MTKHKLYLTGNQLALLDLLITASDDGQVLSNQDIQDEIDTFMFEVLFSSKNNYWLKRGQKFLMFKGHDTSASMMGWFLYLMAANPECQVNYLLYYIIYLQSKIKYFFGIYGEFHMIPCTTIALYNRKKRTTNY